MKRFLLALGMTTAVVLPLLAAPAAATPPSRYTVHREGTLTFLACEAFVVVDDFVFDTTYTRFFDNDGDPIALLAEVEGSDTFTNSASGTTYTGRVRLAQRFDLRTGQVSVHGIVYQLTIPGYGSVLLDVGRLVFDGSGEVVFEAGPHQIFDGTLDVARFCEAMA
ncbi:hypothetical protein [Allorhizocola rhizosphaerae]|uniref:hypothetical protein n=1 Tax=Allorhizocola rhizosphaerae TaxID=1872709 RepID=UPI000E3E0B85|nr:hypothetical protein [Allorhizocola rhizosphaerae]